MDGRAAFDAEATQTLILGKTHEPYVQDLLEVAQLYKVKGRFDGASGAIKSCLADEIGVPEMLIGQLNNQVRKLRSVSVCNQCVGNRHPANSG